MFQFPRFAPYTYVFSARYHTCGGFPHSDIRGSKVVRTSPRLFAAYHVLHRLLMPRHPSDALLRLIYSMINIIFSTSKIVQSRTLLNTFWSVMIYLMSVFSFTTFSCCKIECQKKKPLQISFVFFKTRYTYLRVFFNLACLYNVKEQKQV